MGFASILTERLFAPFASRLARAGVSPTMQALLGAVAGFAAAAGVATQHFPVGLAFLIVSRLVFLVATAEQSSAARFSAVLAWIALASMPFAFALAEPDRAIAASFQLFGFLAVAASSYADEETPWSGPFSVAALIGLIVACIVPAWFSLECYAIGILGFVTCGAIVAGGERSL